jgi:hypothetical protein
LLEETLETYLTGLIEGFYGRSWSWQERQSSVDFLRNNGLNSYVYAPKADSCLRREWDKPWTDQHYVKLNALAEYCRECGIQWGLGLSPLDAYIDYNARTLERLEPKLAAIDQLRPEILCILFDDMRGDVPNLAQLQVRMVEDIASRSSASRIIVCPTYYSDDPVLERVFGAMPARYWHQLGSELDPAIDFFWTGDRVCSEQFSRESVSVITEAMQRAPVLWDNYPVNDGAKMSRRLNLRPFRGRPADIRQWSRGHLANPMNQACLSRVALCTMPTCYSPAQGFEQALDRTVPRGLASLLQRDLILFNDEGLDAIDSGRQQRLVKEYGAFDHPLADEVVGWLQGDYSFDPACLTD